MEDHDVHLCCVCCKTANSWRDRQIPCILSKGCRLEEISTLQMEESKIRSNTYRYASRKNNEDECNPNDQAFAPIVESISADD